MLDYFLVEGLQMIQMFWNLINYIIQDTNPLIGNLSPTIPHFVSDNMYMIRIFSYGLIGAIFSYVFHLLIFIKFFGINNLFLWVVLFILFLCELGVRSFSSPEVFFLIFLVLLYNSSYIVKSRT